MRIIIFAFFIFCTYSSVGQQHRPYTTRCKLYVPGSYSNLVALPDSWASCPPCDEIKKEENKRMEAFYKREEQAREAQIKAAKEKREADIRAEKLSIEKRNAIANAKIKNLEAQDVRMTTESRARYQRDKAINEKYDKINEQNLKEYQQFMEDLKQASAKNIPAASNSFWNETAMLENLVSFRDSRTGNYGFKDKKGEIKIAPKFQQAIGFNGGIAYVTYPKAANMHPAIINTNEKVIATWPPTMTSKLSEQFKDIKINHFNPQAISGQGTVVVAFFGKKINDQYDSQFFSLVDRQGNLLTTRQFSSINTFENGRAVASIQHKSEKFEGPTTQNRWVNFIYFEEGVIDARGNWVETPRKMMTYFEDRKITGGIILTSKDAPRKTEAEERAEKAAKELRERQHNQQVRMELDAEIRKRTEQAVNDGYLIRKPNS